MTKKAFLTVIVLGAAASVVLDARAAGDPPATQSTSDAGALIRQLGADDFHVRQDASAALRGMGKAAIPALHQGLASNDPEIHGRIEQLLDELERPPALPVPRATGAGSSATSISVINNIKTVDIQEPGRNTHIEEGPEGIAMKVTGDINGTQVTREYKARNGEQLRKENPEAFALYSQSAGSDGANFIQARIVAQQNMRVQINGNVAVMVGPGGVAAQPGGDNLQQLDEKLADQMKAASIPDDQQGQVRDLMKKLRETRPPLGQPIEQADALMRDYNQQCDALRKKLADLKLPDPGDALPPPASGRLGVVSTEEMVPGQGITITHVLADSRAAKMGIKEQDVIQKVNGQEIHATHDLRKALMAPGKGLVIEVLRDGAPVKLEEPAEKKPDANPKPADH